MAFAINASALFRAMPLLFSFWDALSAPSELKEGYYITHHIDPVLRSEESFVPPRALKAITGVEPNQSSSQIALEEVSSSKVSEAGNENITSGSAIGAKRRQVPEVWIAPPSISPSEGSAMRDLFLNEDSWTETRLCVTGLLYADHALERQFTETELRSWFNQMTKWGIKLDLEVGAVKPWGVTGARAFEIGRRKWSRLLELGAPIHALLLDEPRTAARKLAQSGRIATDNSDEYALRETVSFISSLRRNYPDFQVGIIDTFPEHSASDQIRWLDALQKRLAKENVRGIEFWRIDVDWANFTVGRGDWAMVKHIETEVRHRRVQFGLIYWAADYPAMNRIGIADDSTWYVGLMQQGYDYAAVAGRPDQYVIESWIGVPKRSIPEAAEWSFSRSVRDFCRKFPQARTATPE